MMNSPERGYLSTKDGPGIACGKSRAGHSRPVNAKAQKGMRIINLPGDGKGSGAPKAWRCHGRLCWIRSSSRRVNCSLSLREMQAHL